MNIETTLTHAEALRLLDLFRQFRADRPGSEENEREKNALDVLEEKLGKCEGSLNEFERSVLLTAAANDRECPDRDYRRYKAKLGIESRQTKASEE